MRCVAAEHNESHEERAEDKREEGLVKALHNDELAVILFFALCLINHEIPRKGRCA